MKKRLNEGGIPGEETQEGVDYISYVQGALYDLVEYYGLSVDVESLLDDNLEIILEFMADREEPNDAAEFIIKGAIGPEAWNIATMQSGANENVKAKFVSESLDN